MNEQLKKRLIGAAVLVALAVIFLPMLLNGSGEGAATGGNPASQPDYEFQTIEIPLRVPAPSEPTDQGVVVAAGEPATGEEPVPSEEPDPAETPPQESSSPSAAPPVAAKPAATQREIQVPKVGPSSAGWVVQIGSFGQAANAVALRDKARAKGFTVFVEQFKGPAGIAYRVRVGPESKRENAEALKTKLRYKLALDGVVMPHP